MSATKRTPAKKAQTPYEVLEVPIDVTQDSLQKRYRDLVKKFHPDVNPGDKIAEEMFKAVQEAYDILSDSKKRNEYDKFGKVGGPESTVTVLGKWVVTDPLVKGDIADLYLASREGSPDQFVVKIARSGRDNDLMKAEDGNLKIVCADTKISFHTYYVPVQDSFEASNRRANVFPQVLNYISLQEIQQRYFPKGLNFRHIVWMGNRMMSALGYAHSLGIIHGAPVPSHMLFGPVEGGVILHGLKLVDWCYSVNVGATKKHIPALVKDYADYYPPEVRRKLSPLPGTDIYTLMNGLKAASAHIPSRFNRLFEWALAGSPGSRPRDAWELQDRWTALAKEEYGPPQYAELKIPR